VERGGGKATKQENGSTDREADENDEKRRKKEGRPEPCHLGGLSDESRKQKSGKERAWLDLGHCVANT